MQSERFLHGMKKLEEIDGDAGKNVYERLEKVSPFMAQYLVESFGEVCSLPQINNREREIAVIGACTALGYALPQLKVHVNAGLNVGLTKDEIIAIINPMSAYAGFPATLNALYAAQEVFMERGLV
jgi:4-carboxymuconolactone decarboxylase